MNGLRRTAKLTRRLMLIPSRQRTNVPVHSMPNDVTSLASDLHDTFEKSSPILIVDAFARPKIVCLGLAKRNVRQGKLATATVETEAPVLSDEYTSSMRALVDGLRKLGRKVDVLPPQNQTPGSPPYTPPYPLTKAFVLHHANGGGHE